MRNILIASGVIALATTASVAAPRGAIPNATPIGKPVSCISTSRIRETHVHGDSTIDFTMNGGKVYRNTLPNACPSLGFEERFLYKTSTSELCSVDVITVLQSPGISQGATCGLGMFQPVELEKKNKR
ncbi:hypothetical protein BH09PSE3_BH09PSE3_26200 [soil metagenome]